MSERDRGMAIALLAEAFGVKDLTAAQIRIYDKALEKVPVSVLPSMTERVIATRRPQYGKLPIIADVLADAEVCRIALLASHAFEPCGTCSNGWADVRIDGVHRGVRRCWCWIAHQQKVASLGSEPLALPPAEDPVNWTGQE